MGFQDKSLLQRIYDVPVGIFTEEVTPYFHAEPFRFSLGLEIYG
jgi:hypothetical protein